MLNEGIECGPRRLQRRSCSRMAPGGDAVRITNVDVERRRKMLVFDGGIHDGSEDKENRRVNGGKGVTKQVSRQGRMPLKSCNAIGRRISDMEASDREATWQPGRIPREDLSWERDLRSNACHTSTKAARPSLKAREDLSSLSSCSSSQDSVRVQVGSSSSSSSNFRKRTDERCGFSKKKIEAFHAGNTSVGRWPSRTISACKVNQAKIPQSLHTQQSVPAPKMQARIRSSSFRSSRVSASPQSPPLVGPSIGKFSVRVVDAANAHRPWILTPTRPAKTMTMFPDLTHAPSSAHSNSRKTVPFKSAHDPASNSSLSQSLKLRHTTLRGNLQQQTVSSGDEIQSPCNCMKLKSQSIGSPRKAGFLVRKKQLPQRSPRKKLSSQMQVLDSHSPNLQHSIPTTGSSEEKITAPSKGLEEKLPSVEIPRQAGIPGRKKQASQRSLGKVLSEKLEDLEENQGIAGFPGAKKKCCFNISKIYLLGKQDVSLANALPSHPPRRKWPGSLGFLIKPVDAAASAARLEDPVVLEAISILPVTSTLQTKGMTAIQTQSATSASNTHNKYFSSCTQQCRPIDVNSVSFSLVHEVLSKDTCKENIEEGERKTIDKELREDHALHVPSCGTSVWPVLRRSLSCGNENNFCCSKTEAGSSFLKHMKGWMNIQRTVKPS